MDNMLETMYAARIGLAAVQIGVLKRVIVIDLSKADEKKDPLFIINPEIINKPICILRRRLFINTKSVCRGEKTKLLQS